MSQKQSLAYKSFSAEEQICFDSIQNFFQDLKINFQGLIIYFQGMKIYFQALKIICLRGTKGYYPHRKSF